MRAPVIIFFLLIGLTGRSQSFPVSKIENNRTVSYFYPNYYYFDNHFNISNPVYNLGLMYSKQKNKKEFYFSLSTNYWVSDFNFEELSNSEYGVAVERTVLYPSFGLKKNIVSFKKIDFNWLSELNLRLGLEHVLLGINTFEFVTHGHTLLDIGGSIGGQVNYQLSKKISFSFDVKQTFYYFRYDRGYAPVQDRGSSKNILTFSTGFGFNF